MIRLVIYLLSLALIAAGLSWLADRPGTLHMVWQGYEIETSVFRAAVILAIAVASAIFLWSLLRILWKSPHLIGHRMASRRKTRGLDALSGGLIAIGSGDGALATRCALQARKSLPHEPLTQLLRAQAAELSGDRSTARRIYEAMLASPETEQLGLRGLFLEAEREGAGEAARQFASRALLSNPKLGWSSDALFETQCKQKSWAGALETLVIAKRNGHIDKISADRKRAVLLTALAADAEDSETDKALAMAMEAHALAPDLVPAAAIAGRILAGRGNTGKASKILQRTWAKSPHPDLATVYAYARIGDSPRDRVDRVRQLAAFQPHSIESPIALAATAIDARYFDEARAALEPLLINRLTQRVATMMARIEAGDSGEKGRIREWLARAATAARDPVWMADGVISNKWEAASPVDGRLDAFQWRVPVETRDDARTEIVASRLEELLAISAEPREDEVREPDAAVVETVRSAGRDVPVSNNLDDAVTLVPEPVTEAAPQAADPTRPSRAPDPIRPMDRTELVTTQAATAKSVAKADSTAHDMPRVPDDPGPDDEPDETVTQFPRRPYRAVN